jgi:hypothetical protein
MRMNGAHPLVVRHFSQPFVMIVSVFGPGHRHCSITAPQEQVTFRCPVPNGTPTFRRLTH